MSDLPVPAPQRVEGHAPRTDRDEPAKGMVPDYVRKLAWILDDAIPLIGNRRIGLDGFLSFIPVIGDAAGFGLAAVVVLSGVRAGCTWPTIVRMLFHAVGETTLGLIPLVGPLFAFAWKANDRNLRIIESNLQDRQATNRESWKVLLVALGMALMLVFFVLAGLAIAAYTVWKWIT